MYVEWFVSGTHLDISILSGVMGTVSNFGHSLKIVVLISFLCRFSICLCFTGK